MSRIETLSQEQWDAVYAERERWRAIGLCTDPANRATTERIIGDFYARLGRTPPRFIWFDGPLSCCVLGPLVIALHSQIESQFCDQLRSQLYNQVESQLANQLYDQLDSQLYDQLYGQLRSQLRSQLYNQLESQLASQIDSQLYSQLRNQLDELSVQVWRLREWGCEWCWWTAFYLVCRDIVGVRYGQRETELLDAWGDLMQSCGWWFPAETVCFCAERHRLLAFDERRLLHCETGPAIECRDGFRVYAWHGTVIPAQWIEQRDSISAETALTWTNVEQRRACCEILGWENVLSRLNVKTIDASADLSLGHVLEAELPDMGPCRFLRVLCGTGRYFCEPIPLEISTAQAAQNWAWDVEHYAPEVRT